MPELVILSGKGGTGKTSVTAAFAALAVPVTLADCDVDAADLHLVAAPETTETHEFRSGWHAVLDQTLCRQCGRCIASCRFDAIHRDRTRYRQLHIDPFACEGCGVCEFVCRMGAISMEEPIRGFWYRSVTRFGPMFHAQLHPGAENSGKLVTLLRRKARQAAEQPNGLLLTDGPPGVGCAAIATLTGADHVLFVTEPTATGLHDLKRAERLAAGFRIPGSVLINKADLSPEMSRSIAEYAGQAGLHLLGEVPFDAAFARAQAAGQTILEYGRSPGADALRVAWSRLQRLLSAKTRTPFRIVKNM